MHNNIDYGSKLDKNVIYRNPNRKKNYREYHGENLTRKENKMERS